MIEKPKNTFLINNFLKFSLKSCSDNKNWIGFFYTISIDLFDIALFIGLGFVFGKAYEKIATYVDYAGISITLFFILFVFGFRYVSKRASVALTDLKTNHTV